MTTLNIQAAQNDIIRQVLNTQDIHLLDLSLIHISEPTRPY